MKQVEPDSEESKNQAAEPATEEARQPEEFPDPNFTIEVTGGPSDGGGGPHTGPPPKG